MVQTFQPGTESPLCGGQGVPKHCSRDQEQSRVAGKLSAYKMTGASPPANGVGAREADLQPISRTDAALQTEGSPPKQSQQRPKSAHCGFRESRRWAKSNAEWIDSDKTNGQHTSNRQRASEDLLRSPPLPITSTVSDSKRNVSHQRSSSDAESLIQAHNITCLGRSLGTGNWLSIRRNTSHRKIQVHHQLVGFVRKLTATGNWASKEPTASLGEPEQQQDSRILAHAAPKPKQTKTSTGRIATLNKKPGMDNIRAQREAADKVRERWDDRNADTIINLNTAEDTPKRSEQMLALREHDLEETKRISADLREVLSEYQSDRHGNLLPKVNTDTIGDFSGVAPQQHEQPVVSSSSTGFPGFAVKLRDASEESRVVDSIEGSTWKASNPSPDGSVLNKTMMPPQPGPRSSSKQDPTFSSTIRCVDESPLIGRLRLCAPGQSPCNESADSIPTVMIPVKGFATRNKELAAHIQSYSPSNTISVFGSAPTKSTDTLTAITVEALGSSRPLTSSNLPETEPVVLKSGMRPTKLHSGYVSSGKAPGDAPNTPLPDLPEAPSPGSSERLRRDADSRASSRSRSSVHRLPAQPGHNRRTSSSNSIASLNGILQGTVSPHSSPQRRSRSGRKSGSVRSSPQKRSNDMSALSDTASTDFPYGETISEQKHSELGQRRALAALDPLHDGRDPASRDQRIHDKRMQDIASARARRGKREMRRDHQIIQEDPTAEDFPPPPSSRPPSRNAIDRQRLDPRSCAQTADMFLTFSPNSAELQRLGGGDMSPSPGTPSLKSEAQKGRATSRSRGASPVRTLGPSRAPVPVSTVIETPKIGLTPKSKHSHVSLRSNANIAHGHSVHGTQTPPLSEFSTPSSDEDGTGVVGGVTANRAKIQKQLHLSHSDLAAMVVDMHGMREQLDAQRRQIHAQSKQLRAIEVHKLRMVDAVNALVAVVREPGAVVPVRSREHERQAIVPHLGSFSWPDRDSIASTSNTVASASSGSSGSSASDATFITEPDPLGSGVASPVGQESAEFDMDFDRMQELIRLDRKKVGGRDGRARGSSRRRKSGGAVGYLSINA